MVLYGDALTILRTMPEASVQCCVTSPPYYGLRDYGVDGQIGLEKTPDEFIARLVAVFSEVRRVLKPDGTLWVNIGDSYNAQPGQRRATDKPGDKQSTNNGSVGVPSRSIEGLKPKDLIGIPWMLAFALRSEGWWLRQDIIWHKTNPMPESVQDRCTKAHEYVFLFAKSERYLWNLEAMREPREKVGTLGHLQGGNGKRAGSREGLRREIVAAKRLDPDAKALESFEVCGDGLYRQSRNRRSVWTLASMPTPEAHFATFPIELPELCIKASTGPGDTVLDPFAGAGTTWLACLKHGREFVGIELNPDYIGIAEARANRHYPLLVSMPKNCQIETAESEQPHV